MDVTFMHICLSTVLGFVLTWTMFHVTNRKKKATKLADAAAAEERRDGAADVIIVGAGVGGSALAYALAKDGRRVHVIERDLREPERIMGEYMQPGGRFLLSKLDLQDCLEEIDAQKATGFTVYKDGKEAALSYPVDNDIPFEPCARSFHNGRFVQRLRQKASSLSNVRLEQGTVKSLIEEKGVIKGVAYKNSAGEETTAFAPLTVVCDGCYSNLRRSLNDNNAEVLSYQVGYISKNSRLQEHEKLHLIMAKPSSIMLYQIGSTDVRCGFELFPDNFPSIANGEMVTFAKNTLAPQVPPKLREIFLKGLDEGAQIKVTPSKKMGASLSKKKGVIVLGDAFNMRHPAIASGMMVLLSDILILRRLLRPLGNLGDVNQIEEVTKSFYVIRKPMSSTVNTLGHAFSQVLIASSDEAKEAMRQGCYDYLCGGGFGTSGMMALLGGMNPRPLSLIFHLCAITMSSIAHLLSPFPTPLGIWHTLRLFVMSMQMLVPNLKAEGVSQMLYPANAAAYRKSYMTATAL